MKSIEYDCYYNYNKYARNHYNVGKELIEYLINEFKYNNIEIYEGIISIASSFYCMKYNILALFISILLVYSISIKLISKSFFFNNSM